MLTHKPDIRTALQLKSAAADIPQKQQLEQQFASMAQTFVADRAPRLAEHLRWFEIVDAKEDGTKAVGVFVAQDAQNTYLIPVFYTQGEIKGVDSMIVRAESAFRPLTESWINHYLDSQARHSGSVYSGDTQQMLRDTAPRNISQVLQPFSTKFANDATGLRALARTWWAEFSAKCAADIETGRGALEILTKAANPADKPKIKAASSKVHAWIKSAGERQANGLVELLGRGSWQSILKVAYDDVTGLIPETFDNVRAPELRMIRLGDRAAAGLGAKQADVAEKLVADGFYIDDRRPASDVVEFLDHQVPMSLQTATVPGSYRLLMADGAVSEVNVYQRTDPTSHLWAPGSRRDQTSLCKDLTAMQNATGVFSNASPLFVMPSEKKTRGTDSGVRFSALEAGKSYMAVNDDYDAFGPVRIRSLRERSGGTEALASGEYSGNITRTPARFASAKPVRQERDPNTHMNYNNSDAMLDGSLPCSPCGGDEYILVSGSGESNALHISGNRMNFGGSWRFVELPNTRVLDYNDPKSVEKSEAVSSAIAQFKPAGYVAASEYAVTMGGRSRKVKIACTHGNFKVSIDGRVSGDMRAADAAWYLARNAGVRGVKAAELVKLAAAEPAVEHTFHTKQAQVVMPPYVPQEGYTNQLNGAMMTEPDVQMLRGETPEQYQRMPYGEPGMGVTSPQVIGGGSAESAAAAGVEAGADDVVDASVLAGLADVTDLEAVLSTFLPSWLETLDKLGRTLFLLYWRTEEFAELFGEEDIAGLEDRLRAVFKRFGEIVLDVTYTSGNRKASIS